MGVREKSWGLIRNLKDVREKGWSKILEELILKWDYKLRWLVGFRQG